MSEEVVKTGVDAFIELLNNNGKMALSEAAKQLNIPESVIKEWVEFLVEEKIIGIEYKFTKPYVYLNKPTEKQKSKIIKEKKWDLEEFKKDFYERAAARKIPEEQIGTLWQEHLKNQLLLEKPFFTREARKRGLTNTEELWQEYVNKVMGVANGTQ